MTTLPEVLYCADQVREFDRLAIEQHNIPGYQLMQHAGMAAYRCLEKHWPLAEKVLIACGPGNNGGDGYVLARLCHESGLSVMTIALSDTQLLQGDALTAYNDAVASGVVVMQYYDDVDCSHYDLIVDALFGTGLQRALGGDAKAFVEKINKALAPAFAIDIPSGLLADTGLPAGVDGLAVEAEVSLSFIGLKQGMFTGLAANYCGAIEFDNLDVPAAVYSGHFATANRYLGADIAELLPPRKQATHKGQCGHTLLVGGKIGHGGAIRMAAEAALRVGSGLVTVAAHTSNAALISAARPEIMSFGIDKAEILKPLMAEANALVVGPGMGVGGMATDLWHRLINCEKPTVMDADGLNILATNVKVYDNWILTPHPGEAARLLGVETSEIQADRFVAVKALQQRYGGVVVLKGSGTLICDQEGNISVVNAGNPGMASGGMGDVLAGVIGGLLAQGLSTIDAARTGVWLHATAADSAVKMGERGLLATDLLPHLRGLVNPGVSPTANS
ncbi:MAG: NAD(P)H-hydrate dehydratase [Gammaproteobacteria bacterium]|nr:NAD(P)H-hydrate dehydratase [Gammaproteobacteria bacterium]